MFQEGTYSCCPQRSLFQWVVMKPQRNLQLQVHSHYINFLNHEYHKPISPLWATRFLQPYGLLACSTYIVRAQPCSFLYICLAGLPRHPPPTGTLQYGVCQCSFRSHHMSKTTELPLLNSLQQNFPMCSATILCIYMLGDAQES